MGKSDDEDDYVGEDSLQERIKTAKANRAVAKRKFSRIYNLFKETVQDENAFTMLKDLINEVNESYLHVESCNDNYMLLVTEEDENDVALEAADKYITDLEKMNMEVKFIYRTLEGGKEEKVQSERKLKVKPLLPPTFSGGASGVRVYGDFICDYDRLMVNNYGKDPYALRSCLSGEP